MKKKKVSALSLRRETIRSLASDNPARRQDLARARGAAAKALSINPCTQIVSDCLYCTTPIDGCPGNTTPATGCAVAIGDAQA
jgi:hypothetical protein